MQTYLVDRTGTAPAPAILDWRAIGDFCNVEGTLPPPPDAGTAVHGHLGRDGRTAARSWLSQDTLSPFVSKTSCASHFRAFSGFAHPFFPSLAFPFSRCNHPIYHVPRYNCAMIRPVEKTDTGHKRKTVARLASLLFAGSGISLLLKVYCTDHPPPLKHPLHP